MKIEVLITDLDPTENLINRIKNIIAFCLKDYEYSEDNLDTIIISDDAHFKKAVQRFNPNGVYTKDEVYVAVGKNFPILTTEGKVKHSVIFHSSVFNAIFSGLQKSSDSENWEDEECRFLFVIYHEIAHCIDNQKRGIRINRPIRRDDKLFKIRNVANYYIDILKDEFVSCVIAGFAMRKKVFDLEMKSTNEAIEERLSEAKALRNRYYKDNGLLYEIAFAVSGTIWTILIQYGKLIGSKIVNRQLTNVSMNLWNGGSEASRKVLTQFEEGLGKFWDSYPDFSDAFDEFLFGIWSALALCLGYKFVETNTFDEIFW
jgi:hypothetical protein